MPWSLIMKNLTKLNFFNVINLKLAFHYEYYNI